MSDNSKLKFLENIFGEGSYQSNTRELLLYCPFCFHHKKKLSINLSNDYWKCWVCEKAGKSLFSLLKKSNSPESQIKEYSENFRASKESSVEFFEKAFKASLPQEYLPLAGAKKTPTVNRFFTYLYRRGVSDETILRYKLGYCTSGDYSDRVILPSFDSVGNLNFFTGRDITGYSGLNYLNEKDLPLDYKSSIIVNELNIDFSKPVVLVEGYFDMFKHPHNTIPICGSSISKEAYLFQKLVRKKTDVILALDSDARKKTLKIAKNFLAYDLNVSYVNVAPFKDLGSMEEVEALEKINTPTIVNDSFLLRSRIWDLSA